MVVARRGQRLVDHLKGTMSKVEELVKANPVRQVIECMASEVGVGLNHVVDAVKLAGMLHDIGKSLSAYQRRALEDERPSFRLHEVVSANIYAKACLIHAESEGVYPHPYPWLVGLTLQSIILHHQGLRTLTIESLFDRGLRRLVEDGLNESMANIRQVVSELKAGISHKPTLRLLEVVEEYAREVLEYNPQLVQQVFSLVEGPSKTYLARIATACLMIADCWDAYMATRDTTSRYIEDAVLRYLRTLNMRLG